MPTLRFHIVLTFESQRAFGEDSCHWSRCSRYSICIDGGRIYNFPECMHSQKYNPDTTYKEDYQGGDFASRQTHEQINIQAVYQEDNQAKPSACAKYSMFTILAATIL